MTTDIKALTESHRELVRLLDAAKIRGTGVTGSRAAYLADRIEQALDRARLLTDDGGGT